MGLTRPKYSQIYDSDWKNSCRVSTTGAVTLVGGAPNSVDGVTLNLYDRVLVRLQTNGAQNGIYYVSVVGTGANGTWIRALDADDATKLNAGATVDIAEGSTLAGKSYRLTTPDPITLGSTALTWTDASGGGGASAGGSSGQIQFNNLNTFSGASYLYYNTVTGLVTANGGISSTSTTSGTMVVTGGIGISGNVYSANANVTTSIVRNNRNVVTNFTGNTAPSSPLQGDEWFRSNTGVMYKYLYDSISNTFNWIDMTSALFNANTGAIANTLALRDSGGNLTATNFLGVASSAKYADLAEIYASDKPYVPATVVVFGGTAEVTTTKKTHDTRVAGVVSTNPAYLMNSEAIGVPVAFTGRVPCFVRGPVERGDILVTSAYESYAERMTNALYQPGCVLGKALGQVAENEFATIEVVVGRF